MLKNNQGTLNCYSNVKIKICKNNAILETREYHNTVTFNLFKGIGAFLQNMVTSVNSHSNYIPKYLGVGTGSGSFNVSSTKLNSELSITRLTLTNNAIKESKSDKNLNYNDILSIPYVVTIPYTSVSTNTITEIGLFPTQTSGTSDMLAGLNLTEPITVSKGSSVIIEWDINLQAVTPTTGGTN